MLPTCLDVVLVLVCKSLPGNGMAGCVMGVVSRRTCVYSTAYRS